jgi:hypothetical protein
LIFTGSDVIITPLHHTDPGKRTMPEGETIRIACRRHDWIDSLFSGLAAPSIQFTEQDNPPLATLLSAPPSFDFIEQGLLNFVCQRAQLAPVKALPMFIRLALRHSYIYVRRTRASGRRRTSKDGASARATT